MALSNLNPSALNLLKLANHLLKYDRELTLGRIQLFLLIAQSGDEGILVRELIQKTGLAQSTVARALAFLSEKTLRGQKEALRWVDARPDPYDPRRHYLYVTPKGQTVLTEIETLLA
jgi:DNA-binding MarR family transcriptional regulator